MEDLGYIKVSRRELIRYMRYETHREEAAYIYSLIALAQTELRRTVEAYGISIELKRGQVAISDSDLAEMWNISVRKTAQMIKNLVMSGFIDWQVIGDFNLITVENYQSNYFYPTDNE